jgi:hypothetical protein
MRLLLQLVVPEKLYISKELLPLQLQQVMETRLKQLSHQALIISDPNQRQDAGALQAV